MSTVRESAVAGLFYPADPVTLRELCDELLAAAVDGAAAGASHDRDRVRAIVAPHAGYRFSGPTAAIAYERLDPDRIDRVVLLGPTHRVGIRGMALDGAEAFGTPLGDVPVDADLAEIAAAHPAVVTEPRVHAQEHSLEVHLPFLQRRLGDFTVLPLAVGEVPPPVVADLLATMPADSRTVVLVSSDLSHFERAVAARRHDARTIERILAHDATLAGEDACGVRPLNGLLVHAEAQAWRGRFLAACNSGDTPDGDPQRVVGYASLAWTDPDSETR